MASKKSKAKIKGRPKIEGLKISTPTISGNSLTVEWDYKDNMVSEKNAHRAEGFIVQWHFSYTGDPAAAIKTANEHITHTNIYSAVNGGAKTTALTVAEIIHPTTKTKIGKKVYLRGQGTIEVDICGETNFKKKQHTVTIDPEYLYPKKSTQLVSVYCSIIPYNHWSSNKEKNGKSSQITLAQTSLTKKQKDAGKKPEDKWTKSSTLKIKAPKKPEISAISINPNGTWSCTVKSPKSESAKAIDRRDLYYEVHVYDHAKKKWVCKKKDKSTQETVTIHEPSFASTYPNLSENDWIGIKVYAWTRGINGKTALKTNPKERYFSYPMQPMIDGITYEADKSYVWDKQQGRWERTGANVHNGIVIVKIKIPWDTKAGKASNAADNKKHFSISKMQLQRLSGTHITNPAFAEVENGWQDVQDSVGTGSCTGLSDLYADAYPAAGDTVWYRIKATHDSKIRYSKPVRATQLEHKVQVGTANFMIAKVVDDGVYPTGIYIAAGVNLAAGQERRDTGVEFEWSDKKDAIYSNNPPTTGDSELFYSKAKANEKNQLYKKSYQHVMPYYITGLTEGTKYYLALRPYVNASGGKVYGKRNSWKNWTPILFARKPTQVVLSAPSYVKSGEDFEVSWDFVSAVRQKEYTLYYKKPKRDGQGNVIYKTDGTADYKEIAIKSEKTSKTYTTVDAKTAASIQEDRKVTLMIAVSCGGPEAKSKNAVVQFPKTPSLKLTRISSQMPLSNGTVLYTKQKRAFQVTTNDVGGTLYFRVVSDGITCNHPDGVYSQAAGEVMYSGSKKITASPTSVTLPHISGLEDGCRYTINAFIVNPNTGWKSSECNLSFKVQWAHQAKTCATGSYAKAFSAQDKVKIFAKAPSGAATTDKWSLYRVTPDGAQLIRSGIKFGSSVEDPYPPYGRYVKLRYRVVTVTADGDLAWRDLSYNYPYFGLSFDWGTGRYKKSLWLPYNLKHADDYTKQFEGVRDLAGGKTGWWNPGVDRNAKYTTEMIRLGDPATKEKIRELAAYPGPVFVRTEYGAAFTANVNVKSFAEDYDRLVSGVTLECEEIDLVDNFQIQ